MIRASRDQDAEAIYAIINDAAQAYRGVIPADRWHERLHAARGSWRRKSRQAYGSGCTRPTAA
jgi:hypothetical protein